MAKKILLVEDHDAFRSLIRDELVEAGYRVFEAEKAELGYQLFLAQQPDLAVLDLSLPDGTGLDVCRRIREHKTLGQTPVIILTSQAEFETKATAFKGGADQYLTKPLPPKELLLWVESLLRRVGFAQDAEGQLAAGDLVIDPQAHLVRFRDRQIADLTAKEFELLHFLVKKRPKVLSRKAILSQLWKTVAVDHVVDTHIGNLRKKIPVELSDRIQAVPGKGFRYFG